MLNLSIFLVSVLVFLFLISYILFRIVFYVPRRKRIDPEIVPLLTGKIYEPFHDQMRSWVIQARHTPHKDVSILSFDGLKLTGKYYEFDPGAPVEIMFHGYRGSAERDLSGGLHRAFRLGHSALIVDQRCGGNSEGNVITFGILEHRDCLDWVNFVIQYLGSDVPIILTGISMGASTVLLAAGCRLPDNVVGILADCGFHAAKDVILSVTRSMHLPARVLYPLVRIGAQIFGHFDLEEKTSVEAVRKCEVPVIFFHGLDDAYVPSYMSQIVYDACTSRKKLVMIPGAGHGLSFPVAPEQYIQEIKSFFAEF